MRIQRIAQQLGLLGFKFADGLQNSWLRQKIYTLNAANQAGHATLLAQVTIDPQAMVEITSG